MNGVQGTNVVEIILFVLRRAQTSILATRNIKHMIVLKIQENVIILWTVQVMESQVEIFQVVLVRVIQVGKI